MGEEQMVQMAPWRATLQGPVWAVTETFLLGNSHRTMEHEPRMTTPWTGKVGLLCV